jgi:HAD superfamily hydrolase (TIGR01509 family)
VTLKALIWDCDGVLADTERDGHRVTFNQVFEEEGLGVQWDVPTYGEKLKIAGGKERMRTILDAPGFAKEIGDKDEYLKKLHKRKTDLYVSLIEEGRLPPRPGVARFMREAHAAGMRLAIASTSAERSVRGIARQLGDDIYGWFEVVLAGDVVPKKKPAPDIYNLAAEKLGLDPSECLVVEDNENGYKAARAAKMNVLVTRSVYSQHEHFPEALLVVDELGDGPGGLKFADVRKKFEA